MTTQIKRPRIEIAKHSLALVRYAGAFGESPLYYIEGVEYDGEGEIVSYTLNELRLAGQLKVGISVPASRVIAVYAPILNQE
jgi:hypothetical protein